MQALYNHIHLIPDADLNKLYCKTKEINKVTDCLYAKLPAVKIFHYTKSRNAQIKEQGQKCARRTNENLNFISLSLFGLSEVKMF